MKRQITQLIDSVRQCRLCEKALPLGPRPVLQIDPRARILIAGQAPGRRVHENGVPFDDPSGDRLREWLGVSRETFYNPTNVAFLPMGFCYPGTGKSRGFAPETGVCGCLETTTAIMPSANYADIGYRPIRAELAFTAQTQKPDRNRSCLARLCTKYYPPAAPKPEKQYLAQKEPVVFRIIAAGSEEIDPGSS